MTELRQLIFALLILSASGCSFMPEHWLGEMPIPREWPVDLISEPKASEITDGPTLGAVLPMLAVRVPIAPLTEDSWRSYFSETRLHQAIDAALRNNRDLAISLARIEEAKAQADLAAVGLWPALELVAQRSVSHTPATVTSGSGFSSGAASGSGSQGSGSTNQRYDVNLATSYELDFWGRLRSLEGAARANFLASEFAHRAFRLQLIGDVASAWYTLESWQQREYILTEIESSRKLSLTLTEQRRDVGLTSDLETSSARAAYHVARTEHFNASRQRAYAENALRLLLGAEVDPAWLPPLEIEGKGLPVPLFPKVAVAVPSEVILRRPDVQAAEEKLRLARANIGAARAAFLPRISLTASAGSASLALNELFSAGSGAWAFLPVLRLPIFDAGRYRAELDVAKVREHIAVADYERTIQRAFRDVADALVARPYGWVVVAEMYNTADAQAARYQLVKARFEAGMANALELAEAEREKLAGQQTALVARLGIQNSAVAIYKALGGL
ncbi:MAG: efflux transporter outer membrane subunit [Rhodocyclaceae bacterium]|nr:efflux transporter outer membrane subunit [Rhodocyclaceae bacterium]